MAITAEFIGVYIAGIIITTATITVIGATITAITAIGVTYRVVAVSKTSLRRRKGRSTRCGLFPFPTASNIAKLPTYLAANPNAANK